MLFFSSKKNTALIWQDFFFSSCFLLEFFFFTKTLLTLAQHQSIKNSQQPRTGFRKQFLVQILLTRAECVTMYPYNIGLPPSFSSLSKDTQWEICFAKMFKFLLVQILLTRRYTVNLKCPISFRNWFWHLIVANRSIMLIFTKKGQFLLKKFTQGHKCQWRPAKSKTSKLFDIINIHCIIINKCECNTKKRCFNENWKF